MRKSRQVGALPVRARAGRTEVLLITSSNARWIIPKGGRSSELAHAESAAREAHEEAGVAGRIFPEPIGQFTTTSANGRVKRKVDVYVLDVEEEFSDWPEKRRRRRAWVTIPRARKMVSDRSLKRLFSSLKV